MQAASLSSMQFTYYTPGKNKYSGAASTPATLQIFSIKLAEVAGGLQWPLSVYGVVAVRDIVDHNRNFIFSCERGWSQELTQNVCISVCSSFPFDCIYMALHEYVVVD
jgi:hypothetical protein